MSRLIRNFTEMLGLLDRKRFTEKLDSELTSIIETLEQLPGGKGTASMTLTVTLAYDDGRIDIKPTVKTKLPEGKAFQDTPFWTHEGGLSVQHPSQMDLLGVRDVEDRTNRAIA